MEMVCLCGKATSAQNHGVAQLPFKKVVERLHDVFLPVELVGQEAFIAMRDGTNVNELLARLVEIPSHLDEYLPTCMYCSHFMKSIEVRRST